MRIVGKVLDPASDRAWYVTDDGRVVVVSGLEAKMVGSEAEAVYRVLATKAVEDADMQIAVEHVGAYLALKAQIAALEERADGARAAIAECLRVEGAAPGKAWRFEGLGTVAIVAGRKSEKLDRAKLAKAGVAAEVLDAATVKTEGKPSMRVTAWEESDAAE